MVTSRGASRPAAMACRPRGFLMRNSPRSASCRSRLTSRTDRRARSSVELRASIPELDREASCAISGRLAPGVDGGRLRLPDACVVDAGQLGQGAELGAERDPVRRLGHHRGLAGNRITQHGKAVAGADNEGVEAVEIAERALEGLPQVIPLARAPGKIGGGDLGVVVGLEVLPVTFQRFAQTVV